MNHSDTSNRPRPAGRRRAGVVVLALAIFLLGVGESCADRFPEDPVEKFKDALITEFDYMGTIQSRFETTTDPARKKELDATRKMTLAAHRKRLEEAERELTTLAELSQALYLLEWSKFRSYNPTDPWQQINDEVRERMKKRLVDETTAGLEEGTQARQIALCNLIAQNVVMSEDPSLEDNPDMIEPLAKLVDPLRKVLKNTRDDQVRAAAALALGRYVRQAEKVAPALQEILAHPTDYSDKARRAAADALVSLVVYLTGEETVRASEPGVTVRGIQSSRLRPPPPTKEKALEGKEKKKPRERVSYRSILGGVAAAVATASSEGTSDPSAVVRRTSLTALRKAVAETSNEIKMMIQGDVRDLLGRYLSTEYAASARDRDRVWTQEEMKQAAEQRKDLDALLEGLRPALMAFTRKNVLLALQRTLHDSDPGTRLEARRSLDELSRLRRFLIDYDNQIPAQGKTPAKKPTKETRRPVAPTMNRDGTILPTSGMVASSLSPSASIASVRRQKKEADALGKMLLELGEGIVREKASDPNPIARLATVEAVESLGALALPFIPRLVKALDDSDLFVRWVAARTCEKLANSVQKDAPDKAGLIVEHLIPLLDDDDLDPRTAAASAVGAYGPAAKSAVGPLTRKLAKGDVEFRITVMKALEGIGTDSVTALPELAKLFRDPEQRIRAEAARVLGRFGSRAKAYVPQLERLVEDLDLDVRKAATAAILEITRGR